MVKKKHAGGRPPKYKTEFCEKLIQFFDIEPWEEREIPHYKGEEVVWTDIKILPARMPTLRKFAKKLKVAISTVYSWAEKGNTSFHQEFLDAFNIAKGIRKDWLVDLGLSGATPPATFKFVAVNVTDMRDKSETVVDDRTEGNKLEVKDIKDRLNKLEGVGSGLAEK